MRIVFTICILMLQLMAQAQNATSCILKGNEFYSQGQFSQAEVQYRKALEYDPENTTAQYNLANALHKQKKYNESSDQLEQLAAKIKDPVLKEACWYNQGVAFTKLKNLESSIESYKKALRIDPNDQQARENLQKALHELKQQKSQSQQQKQKQNSSMSQKEAEQKLEMLQQKEKDLQERIKNKNKQQGTGQANDW